MIKLGSTDMESLGLKIKRLNGFYDFPKLKDTGLDWPDEHYTEPLSRLQDYQYSSKKFTLECYVKGENWSALETTIDNIANALLFDGLKMLVIDKYSNYGYMVRLVKTTIFKPSRYFENQICVAEFNIVFEEPQSFAVKWFWDFRQTHPAVDVYLSFTIAKLTKSLSLGSTSQQFITVCFDGNQTRVNIEQENFEYPGLLTMDKTLYPIVILGEIDKIEDIVIDCDVPASGLNEAGYFLRNGLISEI